MAVRDDHAGCQSVILDLGQGNQDVGPPGAPSSIAESGGQAVGQPFQHCIG